MATAQDPGELFDLYAKDGTPLGRSKPRALVHRDGDWHRSVHIWVLLETPEASSSRGPALLFQRRSRAKDTWPGALDVAVGGHLSAGETVADALREAEEEIGLSLGPGDVIPLGLRRRADDHAPGILDRELQEILLARTSLPLSAFRPNPAEVDALIALPMEAARALFRGQASEVAGTAIAGVATPSAVLGIKLGDFVLPDDGYYERAVESIAAIIAGRHVAVWEMG
jgi:8-oxo-dGTP pyrophosphatase MutT (NUDIX family)